MFFCYCSWRGKEIIVACARLRHAGIGVALRARNLSKSIQNQTESGRSPFGTSYVRGRSSSEKLIKNLIQKLIALRAEIIWARACGTLILRRPTGGNYSKLFSKLIKNYIGSTAGALYRECPTGRNLSKSIQNQTESLRTPKGILVFWERPTGGN